MVTGVNVVSPFVAPTPIVTDEPIGHIIENDQSLAAATGDPSLRPLSDYLANAANGAMSGANSDITSLSGLTTPLSVAQGGSGTATPGSGVAGTVGGYRNLLRRNGGFEVWQRGAGGSASFPSIAAATPTYTADGWYLTSNGPTCSVSQVSGLGLGTVYAAKVQRNAGQTSTSGIYFGFPLDSDELWPILGNYVRLSFTAKAGADLSAAGGNLTVQLAVGTAAPAKYAAFTSPTTAINQAFPLTTTATRFQITSSAVVIGSTRQAELFFFFAGTGTAGADDSFTVDDVQLEIVPAATGYVSSDFERLNFEEQLLLCQRHYQKTFRYEVAPIQNMGSTAGSQAELIIGAIRVGAGFMYMPHRFNPPMRQTATVTLYNPAAANGEVRDTSVPGDCSGSSATGITSQAMRVNTTTNAGTTLNSLLAVHLSADAGI